LLFKKSNNSFCLRNNCNSYIQNLAKSNQLTPLVDNFDDVFIICISRAVTRLDKLLGPSISGTNLLIVSSNSGKSFDRNDSISSEASLAYTMSPSILPNIIYYLITYIFNYLITSPIIWSKFSLFTFMNPFPLVLKEILRLVALSTHRCPLSDRKHGLNYLNTYIVNIILYIIFVQAKLNCIFHLNLIHES